MNTANTVRYRNCGFDRVAARRAWTAASQSLRFARDLHFSPDPARVIHNADARVLDRNVQSSKTVHAALLLLMLGARTTVTPFHHQPEAQHPKIFQLLGTSSTHVGDLG